MQRHVDSVHRKISYKCDFCTNSYSMKESLDDHIKDIHGGRINSCKICKKVCPSRGALKHHVKSHVKKAKD